MAGASGQDNAQPLSLEEMAARQEESLRQKMEQFLPRFVAMFKKDTQGIRNLKQPPCVTLVSKEGKKFWVPRRIILARCPGLKRLLKGKGEDFSGPVELKNLSSKTLEVLIQYLEEATLHSEWRNLEVIPELCEAAKEYGLPLLFQFLEESLVNLCDSRTAFKSLMDLATSLGMEKASQQIINWVKERVVYLEAVAEHLDAQNALAATKLQHDQLELERKVETLEAEMRRIEARLILVNI